MTDWDRTIEWLGNDYLAVGHFMGIGSILESSALQVNSLSLSLSGIDQTFISLLLEQNYIDRPIKIYRAFVDASGQLITTPFEVFRARLEQPGMLDSPKATSISV